MRCRRYAYNHGIFRSTSTKNLHQGQAGTDGHGKIVPVISIGNITTGGTGKTPMVAHVVNILSANDGKAVAILTRGYKAIAGKSDEAQLLGQLCRANVVVNPNRLAGARSAIAAGACVLVMDDGFQHRRLRRDLDIVLIDAMNLFGFGYCLPRGLLREPTSALKDAHIIIITHGNQVGSDELVALRNKITGLAPQAEIFVAAHEPSQLIGSGGDIQQPGFLAGRKVFAFCGLGNPDSFFNLLRQLGSQITGQLALSDHANYDQACIERINTLAQAGGAEMMITTQKDGVKLGSPSKPALQLALPVWQLALQMRVVDEPEKFQRRILAVLADGDRAG
jgi:tetraacyldisaccharide 4'-kinase